MSDPNRTAEKLRAKEVAEAQYEKEIAGLTFTEWPKIKRLNREIVISEKIDGTNAAIGITEPAPLTSATGEVHSILPSRVYAQSRNRIITPGNDNFGFAAWVQQHSNILVETLGPGLHFGEWWGAGIARGYGLSERRFSLFNTGRWSRGEGVLSLEQARAKGVAIYSVPVLYQGEWMVDTETHFDFAPRFVIGQLNEYGSYAVPGFMKPEGIVVFHTASQTLSKVTCEHDDEWKGRRNDQSQEMSSV